MKEKKFPAMLRVAVKDALETILWSVASTAATIGIIAVIVGPVVGFAKLGWWPLAVLWGTGCAFVGAVIAQSGPQLIYCWKEDHKNENF